MLDQRKGNNYLSQVTELLKRVSPGLAATHKLEFKNVFGAVAGYANGRIFISVGNFGVALRLPPETLATIFKEEGVKHLKYFSQGHVKKEYAVLPKRLLGNSPRFKGLIKESVQFVTTVSK